MDTKQLIKVAAIAGAAFIAYKMFVDDEDVVAIVPTTGNGGAAPPPTQNTQPTGQVPPPATTNGQTQTPTPPAPTNNVPSAEILGRAAAYAANANEAGNFKMNWDQWNWYRAQNNAALPIHAPEEVGVTRNASGQTALYTAAEYHGLLTGYGLEGMGYMRGMGNTFRWRQ